MNMDSLSGYFKHWRGLIREKWGIVFHIESTARKGKEEQLLGSIQMRYGRTRNDAARIIGKVGQKTTENH
jgi:uncharacterized protein YjbJ (UPF0337 family)